MWLENFENFSLSREQRTVIRLGVNGRQISAKEIFETVGIIDEKVYRELLESLRELEVLATVYSQAEINRLRRKYGGSKRAVPKFKIQVPTIDYITDNIEEDRSDYARIYVGNTPYDFNEEDMYEALGKFGEVVDVIIPRWTSGTHKDESKGFCFVEFDKRISANNALNSNSTVLINGRKLRFKEADKLK